MRVTRNVKIILPTVFTTRQRTMEKKMKRSMTDKKVCGVCAGFAEYFNIDPTVIRILYVLITIFSFGIAGIIAYLLMAVIMPEK